MFTSENRFGISKSVAFPLILASVVLGLAPFSSLRADRLENWESCCSAVCLRVAFGLLGGQKSLAEIRRTVQPNEQGAISLVEIMETAKKMDLYAAGLRIRHNKLEQTSVPLIAHKEPHHFVVLLGLGKNRGVGIIDAPRRCRRMSEQELAAQDYWNVIAISRRPLLLSDRHIRKPPAKKATRRDQGIPREYGGLRFENPVWYFGKVRPDTKKKHKFLFVNTNAKWIYLDKVRTTCSPCLKVIRFTDKVPPSGRGIVEVVLYAKGVHGHITKRILGRIKNSEAKKDQDIFALLVRGEVSRRGELVPKPSRLHFGDVTEGVTVREAVLLRRIGYDKLRLKDISSSSPTISYRILSGAEPDAYEARIQVEFDARDGLGQFDYKLIFETDHREFPTTVFHVEGCVVPTISTQPSELFLGLLRQQVTFEKNVMVVSRTGTPFTIKRIQTNPGSLLVASKALDKRQHIWEIKLTNGAPLPSGILKGEVLVETDDKDTPKIRIPLTGLVIRENHE